MDYNWADEDQRDVYWDARLAAEALQRELVGNPNAGQEQQEEVTRITREQQQAYSRYAREEEQSNG
jgi:hypothetical protein